MPTYDLGLEHVSLAFATKTVFTDVTQGVFEGDRIGIVGRNGDGKSTLLKLLDGTQEPDSGRVTRRNGLTFGMLTQRDALDDNATLREAALEGREDYEWASQQQSREIVEALLGGMNLDAKIGSLSGGQRRRADLARLLLKDWDILALDEPTNHLDVITIHWLAEHLKNRWSRGTGALLLVTHDRWFLDEVCESMWEVHDGRSNRSKAATAPTCCSVWSVTGRPTCARPSAATWPAKSSRGSRAGRAHGPRSRNSTSRRPLNSSRMCRRCATRWNSSRWPPRAWASRSWIWST